MSDKEPQLIQQYRNVIQNGGSGEEYTVQSWVRQTDRGEWEGWLEYHPLVDQQRIKKTPTLISRPARGELNQWAAKLGDGYLEEAFDQAK